MIQHWKRKFVTLWVGQAASILTSMISQYALIWYLTYTTGSTAVLSMAMLFGMLPQGILSLFTGAIADRFDRRVIMAVADGAIGVVSLCLALAAADGSLSTGAILAALALRSVGAAFHTPCIQAVTPLIAPPEQLTRCAGWSQGIQTVSTLLSPAIAAALYGRLPLFLLILMDTLGAAFAVLGLLWARLPVLRAGDGRRELRLLADTREGFRILRGKRWLWELTLICALFSIAFLPIAALEPLMSIEHFGRDQNAAALVEVVFSGGMLLGSVLLGIWGGTKNKIYTMFGAQVLLGAVCVVSGLLPPGGYWVFVACSLLMGLSSPFFNSVFLALVQEKVEPEYLGRVFGLSGAVTTLASPLGLLASAVWGDKTGVPVWFLISGIVTLLCGLLSILSPSIRGCDRPLPAGEGYATMEKSDWKEESDHD